MPLRVLLEEGSKRSFACALDWPGWARSAKTADHAIETLIAYADRYRTVLGRAGVSLDWDGVEVHERLAGNATTDFGAPGQIAEADREPLGRDLKRHRMILRACWDAVEHSSAVVDSPLAKGPRGGGRDLGPIVEHLFEAERAYAAKIGVRAAPPAAKPEERRLFLARLLDRLGSADDGKWPHRYYVRRSAWHALDHAWEVEDRSGIQPDS